MLRKWYDNFEEYICVSLCAIMIFCLILQVGIRMVNGSALAWTEELSRYCFLWTVYLGMSLATKRLAQVRITAQFSWASLHIRLIFRVISDGICIILNIFIAWVCYQVVQEEYIFPEISPTLGVVKAHVSIILPLAFLLTTWRTVEMYVVHWKSGTLESLVKNTGEN